MATLLIALGAGVAFIIAYHTYGRWLGGKVFNLAADVVCPSHRLRDDKDYVPTAKPIVFGHHFTSIAGTGPIVGPAIAVMWGWLPALLWVVLGSIFIGAVHDFGALVVSLRNDGQTVGDIAGRVLNRRVRLLFLMVLFMALTVVLAIFGLVIAAVFKKYPAAIFPCLVQIPIAVAIGVYLHRRGVGLFLPSVIALAIMYVTVIYGDVNFKFAFMGFQAGEWGLGTINAWLAARSMMWWVVVLLIYSYFASVLPVWTLLQPRDYINSLQLLTALGLIVVGLIVAAFIGGAPLIPGEKGQPLEIVAPMVEWSPTGAPVIFPFLFITIACGAISGFHCLVSSGTSSKQIQKETDARFIGFGSMLTEGFLATLVILACVAGLGLGIPGPEDISGDATLVGGQLVGESAWQHRYVSWGAAGSLGAKVGAFVDGSANFLKAIGIPAGVAIALMGVLVASFAGTTLDTACRLQRYVVQELAVTFLPKRGPRDCIECGYDLTANVSGKCPECGWEIDWKAATDGHAAGLQRPSVAALWNPIIWLRNKHGATIFAVVIAAVFAAIPANAPPTGFLDAISDGVPVLPSGKIVVGPIGSDTEQVTGLRGGWTWLANFGGKGGLILWPMFGATNQLLGGLSFMVIAFYLWRRSKPIFFLVLPLLFMLVMPAWAMLMSLPGWINPKPLADGTVPPVNWPLVFIAIMMMALEAWMIVEAVLLWPRVRGVLERPVTLEIE